MPNAFNFSESPFDCLSPDEQSLVRNSVDIAYFPKGDAILDVGTTPTHLFVIIKGVVEQWENNEVTNVYRKNDTFDGRGLVAERVSSRFVAAEEVVAYQLAKKTVSTLIATNATFGAMLFSDLSAKLSAITERRSQYEFQSLSLSPVRDAFVRPPHFVDAQTDIVSVVKLFQSARTTTVLVRDQTTTPPRLGIFTHTGLQRAILQSAPLDQFPVGQLANFSVITVRPSDQLGDALALMIRKRVHRVVVTETDHSGHIDGANVIGVLEALDVFAFLSNHSYLITIQIGDAETIDALKQPAQSINRLIAMLHQSGSKVSLIATLVQEMNERLFERAWRLIAPPELVANSCLFVMGSEGRGEQLLKTDQDNGLILRDGYTPPDNLAALCDQFSAALREFGYPDCPGNIMVSNPVWRQTMSEFAQTTRTWLMMPTADTLMSLAIFIDAHSVCGDASLLEHVRKGVFDLVSDNDAMIARFASAMNAFEESGGWWNRFISRGDDTDEALDLKKAGIFPLVHGIRSMALENRITALGTTARIEALVAKEKLTPEMGGELTQSLHFFMGLKLKSGLAEIAAGHEAPSRVSLSSLNSLDRDLLKDTLSVVKRFKLLLRQRYRLDVIS